MTTITTRGPELFAGSRFTWHLTADQTGGQASLADVLVRPGSEPPVHVHAREDEAYIVLEGEVTFLRGSETIDAGPGRPCSCRAAFSTGSRCARRSRA